MTASAELSSLVIPEPVPGMRVLHLGKYYPPVRGGIETVTADLVEGFNARGIQCDVLVFGSGWRRTVEVRRAGRSTYQVIRAAAPVTVASTAVSPDYVRAFIGLHRRYDVVIVHMPNPVASLALRFSGYKGAVGLIWHSDVIRQRHLVRAIRPLQSWTIRRADFVVGATPAHVEQSDSAGLFAGKSHVIPFGLHQTGSAHGRGGGTAGPREKTSVLAVGRLVYYKGFDVLLDAMHRLGRSYELLIVGDGPLRSDLERRVAELGLGERVRLAGSIAPAELDAAFAACDIFCLPSVERSEMYGMVQLEAMARGKPLVVTNVPRSGVPYVNRDGVTGFTVPPRDAVALADAIRRLGEDEEMRSRFGRAARDLFAEEYTAERMVERHVELYRRTLLDREAATQPESGMARRSA